MTQTTTKVLNELIHTLKDGENGYSTAAKDAARADLKEVFHDFATQRMVLARNLQQIVKQMGDEPDDSGTLAADLHRGWISLKSVVVARADLEILEDCLRGDESAIGTYRQALEEEDLGAAEPVVQKQLSEIREARNRVVELRDELAADQPGDGPVMA